MNYFLRNYALKTDFVFIRTCKMVNEEDNDRENDLFKNLFNRIINKSNCLLDLDCFKKL